MDVSAICVVLFLDLKDAVDFLVNFLAHLLRDVRLLLIKSLTHGLNVYWLRLAMRQCSHLTWAFVIVSGPTSRHLIGAHCFIKGRPVLREIQVFFAHCVLEDHVVGLNDLF